MDVCVCIHTKSEFVKQDRLQRLTKKKITLGQNPLNLGESMLAYFI